MLRPILADKIIPHHGLLTQYESIWQSCRNPFFKSRLLLNLLRGLDWTEGFLGLFSDYPADFFVLTEKTPSKFGFFSFDIRKKFETLIDEFRRLQEVHAMAEETVFKPQSLGEAHLRYDWCVYQTKDRVQVEDQME